MLVQSRRDRGPDESRFFLGISTHISSSPHCARGLRQDNSKIFDKDENHGEVTDLKLRSVFVEKMRLTTDCEITSFVDQRLIAVSLSMKELSAKGIPQKLGVTLGSEAVAYSTATKCLHTARVLSQNDGAHPEAELMGLTQLTKPS
jgi:hypothetical protein